MKSFVLAATLLVASSTSVPAIPSPGVQEPWQTSCFPDRIKLMTSLAYAGFVPVIIMYGSSPESKESNGVLLQQQGTLNWVLVFAKNPNETTGACIIAAGTSMDAPASSSRNEGRTPPPASNVFPL